MFRKPPVPSVSEGTTSGAREHRGSNPARRAQRKTTLTWPEIVRRRAMPPSNSASIHLNLPKPDFLASTLANRPHRTHARLTREAGRDSDRRWMES